ncbi:MAG TPA: RHS repeat-associated core domain-containing protein [Burkholderiales bacterium]|nr:RHS repeat-associated core domain-containing protein [Burkholderiales bacterium]
MLMRDPVERARARRPALLLIVSGLWLVGAANAQTPMTLWITNVQGYGSFPPSWYPLLGRTPAEACEKNFAEVVAQNARAYEYNLATYGAELACPGIAEMVSPAPSCTYNASPSYVRVAPGLDCATVGLPQNLPNIGFSFPIADSKAAGQAPFGACSRANPVNLGNGNKVQIESDYQAFGALSLRFMRTYNSRGVQAVGRIGRGWRHEFESFIAVDEFNGRAMAHRTNGAVYVFARAGAAWNPDADIPDRLDQVLDANGQPAGWRYRAAGADDRAEVYDGGGRLTAIEDKTGRALSLQYATHPTTGVRLTAVVDPFGRTLAFGYDSVGRIDRITDPAGQVHQYEYDALGNLVVVTRPDSTTRRYHYEKTGDAPMDASGYMPETALTGITDENGTRFATFDYDTQGRATLSKHALDAERVVLTHSGDAVAVVDALGATRTYALEDVLGTKKNSTTTGDPGCPLGFAARTFDTTGMPSSQTDWNGNVTQTTRDARGLETLRVEAAGSAQERRISTEWHGFYRLPARVAEPLRISTYTYGEPNDPNPGNRGSVLTRTVQATSDATGAQGFSASAVGTSRTWTYTYNANGQVVSADGPRTDVSDVTTYTYYPNDDPDLGKRGNVATVTNARGHVTQVVAYNAHGQPTELRDLNGLVTTLTYDVRQRLTSRNLGGELTSYEYDGVGQLTRVTLPDGSFLAYSYDAAHRLTGIADAFGNRVAYTLDLMGNRIKEEVFDPSNALAQARSRVYSSLNRLIQEIGAQNQTTRYAYDNQGNLTGITDPLNRVIANAYDALNRLKHMTDPSAGVTRFGHDGLDQLISVTDSRNNVTAYTIDGLGNLTQQASPDAGITTANRDAAGNVISFTDAKGQTTTSTYDALNRISRIVYAQATGSQLRQVDYAYDEGPHGIGRLTAITETSAAGSVLQSSTYGYDEKGRVTAEARTIGGATATTVYTYDGAGRMSGMIYPSGRTTSYQFDALGRVNRIETTGGGTSQVMLQDVAYQSFGPVKGFTFGNLQAYARSFDLDGRIATYSLANQAKTLSFDAASRITRIEQQGTPANLTDYGYDALDRLTSAILPASSFGFGYDAVGNRLSKSTPSGSDTYTISPTSNRIASITGSTVRTYAHDANGSITSDGSNGFAYDPRGRLVSSTSAIGTTTYQVNALGQRVRKTSPLEDVAFHYDTHGRLIAESASGGNPIREYLWLGDQPVGVAVYPSAAGQCPATPTRDTSRTFAPFERRERMEVRSGRPGEQGWEWGLGTNTRDFEASARADLDWVSGKPYGFTLTYDGAGKARVAVRDGGTELFNLEWSGDMDTGNALRFVVRSPAGIGEGNRIALALTSIDGQPVADTLVTAGDDTESQVGRVYAGASLRDGYSVEGTVTFTFTGGYPPRGSRLDLTVTAGNVVCEGSGQVGSPVLYYIHADHVNTPRVITDQAQQVVWRWENQEPFGNNPPEENPSGLGNFEFNLRFPGQYADRETGLNYNYFRDYDPSTGGYVQSDPIGLRGGLNTYLYVGGNPISYTDPTGLETYQCRRPLGGLPGDNQRSGPDILGNPFYHQYSCTRDAKGNLVCGGQGFSESWWSSPGRPTTPATDYYSAGACKQTQGDNRCFEKCLIDEWKKPRPRYGVPFGTDCQEYDDDVNSRCRKTCGLK